MLKLLNACKNALFRGYAVFCAARASAGSNTIKIVTNSRSQRMDKSDAVVVFVYNVPPTAKVIWRRDNGLKSHQTDW